MRLFRKLDLDCLNDHLCLCLGRSFSATMRDVCPRGAVENPASIHIEADLCMVVEDEMTFSATAHLLLNYNLHAREIVEIIAM